MRITGMRAGWARVAMTVRADMVNGHAVCHGGIVFALADSAFAFACNSHNESTLAAAASIDFLAAAREGDELTAEASELWRSRRNGLYEIIVSNQRGERIALARGRSYPGDGQVVGGGGRACNCRVSWRGSRIPGAGAASGSAAAPPAGGA